MYLAGHRQPQQEKLGVNAGFVSVGIGEGLPRMNLDGIETPGPAPRPVQCPCPAIFAGFGFMVPISRILAPM